jgi:hypothetical protein
MASSSSSSSSSSLQSWSFSFFLMASTLAMFIGSKPAVAVTFHPSPWGLAHATFYGDDTASATMGTEYIYHIIIFIHHFSLSKNKIKS